MPTDPDGTTSPHPPHQPDRHRDSSAFTIFSDALDLPDTERAAFLDKACRGDPALLEEVRGLLDAHQDIDDDGFLAPALNRDAPDRIGRYRLLSVLGQGGMGVVYLAEQTEPVRRRVAVKQIKLGMDTREVIARFESERQALAMLDHPGIARVLDAGATDDGRPYFVMEHVPGVRITAYCNEHHLDIDHRLMLFMSVCRAVQHAHQNGIIHRDLKPSNVLVCEQDGEPTAKIIDFGIAKATHEPLTDSTLRTIEGQIIGTPEYMAPEQAAGSGVDTRADIYALGLILYELLAGRSPFDRDALRKAGPAELLRIVRETEPVRPSLRVIDDADAPPIRKKLRGDLDWIVMKAIARDPDHRYGSPSELIADIERHIGNLPVSAGPPSVRYRMGKLLRRNRLTVSAIIGATVVLLVGLALAQYGWVAATGAVGLTLIAALGIVTYALSIATREKNIAISARESAEADRREAERQMRTLQAVNSFLNDDLLAAAAPEEQGRDVRMLDVLDVAARKLDGKFPDRPDIEAGLRSTLGNTYRSLGELGAAEKQLRAACESRTAILGPEHEQTLQSMLDLAVACVDQDNHLEGETLIRKCITLRTERLGPEHPDTLSALVELAALMNRQGRFDEAEPLYTRTLDGRRQALGRDHPDTITVMNDLALLHKSRGELDKAEPLYAEALDIGTKVRGEHHPATLTTMNNLAGLYYKAERFEEAADLHRRTLRAREHVLGDRHAQTLTSMSNLGGTLTLLGRTEEAEPLLRNALARARDTLPQGHFRTGIYLWYLGRCLCAMDRNKEARDVLLEARDILESKRGPDDAWTRQVNELLATVTPPGRSPEGRPGAHPG